MDGDDTSRGRNRLSEEEEEEEEEGYFVDIESLFREQREYLDKLEVELWWAFVD